MHAYIATPAADSNIQHTDWYMLTYESLTLILVHSYILRVFYQFLHDLDDDLSIIHEIDQELSKIKKGNFTHHLAKHLCLKINSCLFRKFGEILLDTVYPSTVQQCPFRTIFV